MTTETTKTTMKSSPAYEEAAKLALGEWQRRLQMAALYGDGAPALAPALAHLFAREAHAKWAATDERFVAMTPTANPDEARLEAWVASAKATLLNDKYTPTVPLLRPARTDWSDKVTNGMRAAILEQPERWFWVVVSSSGKRVESVSPLSKYTPVATKDEYTMAVGLTTRNLLDLWLQRHVAHSRAEMLNRLAVVPDNAPKLGGLPPMPVVQGGFFSKEAHLCGYAFKGNETPEGMGDVLAYAAKAEAAQRREQAAELVKKAEALEHAARALTAAPAEVAAWYTELRDFADEEVKREALKKGVKLPEPIVKAAPNFIGEGI